MTSLFSRTINWNAVGKTGDLSDEVRHHLTKVYSTLGMALLATVAGNIFFLSTAAVSGLVSGLAIFGLLLWFQMVNKSQITQRLLILTGIAFFQGCAIGPLLNLALNVDPSIIVKAVAGTFAVFACFTGSALLAKRRSYLYLYGLLSSGLTLMVTLSLLNIFVRSESIMNFQLYFGLLVFCGYVIFDTQLIVEKAFSGDRDFVGHALELFLDFIQIFVRILIILLKNSQKDKKKSRR